MKLGKPIRITNGVFQVRGIGARVTVLVHDKKVVLVDAGSKGSLSMISSGLEAEGLSLDDVGKVIVTHHHPDPHGGTERVGPRKRYRSSRPRYRGGNDRGH